MFSVAQTNKNKMPDTHKTLGSIVHISKLKLLLLLKRIGESNAQR